MCSLKKVFRKFAKISVKYLCQSLFFNKKETHRCFPVNFAKCQKFLKFAEFSYRTLQVDASEDLSIYQPNIQVNKQDKE